MLGWLFKKLTPEENRKVRAEILAELEELSRWCAEYKVESAKKEQEREERLEARRKEKLLQKARDMRFILDNI